MKHGQDSYRPPAQPNTEADDLVKQAEKRLKAFSLFDSKEKKYEDASELYTRAATLYKATGHYEESADVMIKNAECQEKLNSVFEAANLYSAAAKTLKRVDMKKSLAIFDIALKIQLQENPLQQAAKLTEDVANSLVEDHQDDLARKKFLDAGKLYEDCDQSATALRAYEKAADIACEQESYKDAVKIYDKCIAMSRTKDLGKFKAKDYAYKSLLCRFVIYARKGDVSRLENDIQFYKDQIVHMDGSRECKLIELCLQSYQDDDDDAFTTAVAKHDEIYKLDRLSNMLLYQVKKLLKEGDSSAMTGDGGDEPDIS